MVTCWERAVLLAIVGDVYCIFVTFPCDILDQVWYLIVLFPDLCHRSYFGDEYLVMLVSCYISIIMVLGPVVSDKIFQNLQLPGQTGLSLSG